MAPEALGSSAEEDGEITSSIVTGSAWKNVGGIRGKNDRSIMKISLHCCTYCLHLRLPEAKILLLQCG